MDWLNDWIKDLFLQMPCPQPKRPEVENLLAELIKIGQTDDFLSERPGAGFNSQCRNLRSIQIGQRLHSMGGLALMEWARFKVKRKLKAQIASHLDYAWDHVGDYRA
jgi:hypothetical protein